MTKLFSLWSVRLLSLGGAKALTNGAEGNEDEDIELRYFVP